MIIHHITIIFAHGQGGLSSWTGLWHGHHALQQYHGHLITHTKISDTNILQYKIYVSYTMIFINQESRPSAVYWATRNQEPNLKCVLRKTRCYVYRNPHFHIQIHVLLLILCRGYCLAHVRQYINIAQWSWGVMYLTKNSQDEAHCKCPQQKEYHDSQMKTYRHK